MSYKNPRRATASSGQHCLLLLLACGFVAASGLSQDVPTAWSTDSPSLAIAAVEHHGTTTTFILKNESNKPITALQICYQSGARGIDYFQSGDVLSPGATCSIAGVGSDEILRMGSVLNVCAVIFADGTSEGAQDQIGFVGGRRLGRVTEVERVKRLLDGWLEKNLSDPDIANLKARIGDLPVAPDEALESGAAVSLPTLDIESIRSADKKLRLGFLVGTSDAREEAQWQIDRLAQLPASAMGVAQSPRARSFSELRKIYRGMSAENHELLQRRKEMEEK